MAVNPKLILTAIEVASSERARKIVLSVVLFTLGLVLLIFITYSSIISGFFGLAQTSTLKNQWNIYSASMSDIFKGLKTEINTDVKKEVNTFMPNFSYNLSKAIASNNSTGDTLMLFDDDELDINRQVMKSTADELRKIKSEKELENYLLGSSIKFSFSDIQQSVFLNDSGIQNIGKYSENLQNYLYHKAKNKSTEYEYVVEPVVVDGKNATYQALIIRNSDEGLKQKVEYICIGGNVYLPELLAMYNVRVNQKSLDDKDLDKQIAEVIGSIPQTQEDYLKYSINSIKYAVNGFELSNLNVLKTFTIKSIIEKAGLKNVATVTTKSDNKTFSITLETITKDDWLKIFELDSKMQPYIEQAQASIEMALQQAQIPQEQWYISLDGVVQMSFFEYFGGLFEYPLESGTNPQISSVFGNLSPLHAHSSGGNVTESGLTLTLKSQSDVYAALLKGADKFVTDAFVYDVWNMDKMKIEKDSVLYNKSAVTLAYIVDLYKFKTAYGFDFPKVVGADYSSGFVTVFIEYSCLGTTALQAQNNIITLPTNENSKRYLGMTHGKNAIDKYNSGSYYHREETCEPHLTIKLSIRGGKTDRTKPDANSKGYKGLSAREIGVAVNPLIWIKGVGASNSVTGNITVAQPK